MTWLSPTRCIARTTHGMLFRYGVASRHPLHINVPHITQTVLVLIPDANRKIDNPPHRTARHHRCSSIFLLAHGAICSLFFPKHPVISQAVVSVSKRVISYATPPPNHPGGTSLFRMLPPTRPPQQSRSHSTFVKSAAFDSKPLKTRCTLRGDVARNTDTSRMKPCPLTSRLHT